MKKKQLEFLKACAGLLEERKLMDFSMDQLAVYAGLSKMTIYKYYPSKQILLESVLLYTLKRWLEEPTSHEEKPDLVKLTLKAVHVHSLIQDYTVHLSPKSLELQLELERIREELKQQVKFFFIAAKDNAKFSGFSYPDFLLLFQVLIEALKNEDREKIEQTARLFGRLTCK